MKATVEGRRKREKSSKKGDARLKRIYEYKRKTDRNGRKFCWKSRSTKISRAGEGGGGEEKGEEEKKKNEEEKKEEE